MIAGGALLQKLITDFKALTFAGGEDLFIDVKSAYREGIRGNRQAILIPDDNSETIRGNTETDRQYGFLLSALEETNSTETDAIVQNMYVRLLNIQDALLDYLQKEPNNLRTWGQNQSTIIPIYKIRLGQPIFLEGKTPSGGYGVEMQFRFTVYINVTVQNL